MSDKQIKGSQYQNGEMVQGSINNESPTYYDTSISSSTDMFAAKTNKYAETDSIEIKAITKGVYAQFSVAGATAAVAAADGTHYIEAGTSKIFEIKGGKKYLRVIEAAASATCCVTELY